MARKLVISTRCWICGNDVEIVSDGMLRAQPHTNNTEYVVTHLGRKQYLHTNCWYGMIEEQKKKRGVS